MTRVFSNGPNKDYVINPFTNLAAKSNNLFLAAPYFTHAATLLEAAQAGKNIQLLVGLNTSTSPDALASIHGKPGIAIRYLTERFHAKIYIFDAAALLGSSNLTDGGLLSNREATIRLDVEEDADAIEEIKALFAELWEAAHVLTDEKLKTFRQSWLSVRAQGKDPDDVIEAAVGKATAPNIHVASRNTTGERIFLEGLRRQVYEQYRPAFREVTSVLDANSFRRPDLSDIGIDNETNRFLNWLRRTYVIGDDAWKFAPARSELDRRNELMRYGAEWVTTDSSKVPDDYKAWLANVARIFATPASIASASKEDISIGLMSLHAFMEQSRFVKGGEKNLAATFWAANDQDLRKVKTTLTLLIHGSGDFIKRLHDVIYDPRISLGRFKKFCALELYGTMRPDDSPPINSRMLKALRFLGYNLPTF